VDRLRREADDLRVQLAAKPTPGVKLPAPTIEILDPKVPVTRGVKLVQTIVAEAQRVVVGHVDAPAGLMSLTFNDSALEVSDKGMFRTDVRVRPGGTKVVIVATDRRASASSACSRSSPGRATCRSRRRASPSPRIDFGRYYALRDWQRQLPSPRSARPGHRARRRARDRGSAREEVRLRGDEAARRVALRHPVPRSTRCARS
jgi:hypothetical protein